MKKLLWCPAICSLCLLFLPKIASSGMRTYIPLVGRLLLGHLGLQWTRAHICYLLAFQICLVSFRFRSLSSPPTMASFQPCWVCRGRYHCTSMEPDSGPRKGEELKRASPQAFSSWTAALPSLCMGVRGFSGGRMSHSHCGRIPWPELLTWRSGRQMFGKFFLKVLNFIWAIH